MCNGARYNVSSRFVQAETPRHDRQTPPLTQLCRKLTEVGIRMALGARLETVTWMFVRSGLVLSAAGIVLGVVAAAGLSRLMSSLLFGVTPLDPVTCAGTALVLLAAAIGASYLPARRAAAGNPLETLRGE